MAVAVVRYPVRSMPGRGGGATSGAATASGTAATAATAASSTAAAHRRVRGMVLTGNWENGCVRGRSELYANGCERVMKRGGESPLVATGGLEDGFRLPAPTAPLQYTFFPVSRGRHSRGNTAMAHKKGQGSVKN